MTTRIPHSDQELLEYSGEHLKYEFAIFQWIVGNLPTGPSFHRSVFLEAFAVHLRNLIDFFYNPPTLADDIIAGDFCDPSGSWNPGMMSAELKAARERANKEVSHITYRRKRRADPTKGWNVSDPFNEIHTLEKRFTQVASADRLHKDVPELVNAPQSIVRVLLQNASTSNSNIANLR